MARVAVVGAGGIGGALAALTAERGHDVTVCVRTPFDVLTVTRDGVERTVPATVAVDPAAVGPTDWVLLATKAQDTASAAGWLAALTGPDTVVVVAQNGIDQADRVDGLVHPGATVLPASVVLGAEAVAPGRVVHHGYGRLTVPAGEAAEGLAALYDGSDLEIAPTDDFTTVAWRKLLSNAVANPVTALTGRRNEVLAEPATRDLVRGARPRGDGGRPLGRRRAHRRRHRRPRRPLRRDAAGTGHLDALRPPRGTPARARVPHRGGGRDRPPDGGADAPERRRPGPAAGVCAPETTRHTTRASTDVA